MMLAATAGRPVVDPLETPLPWFALLAGGIAIVLTWSVYKLVKRRQDRALGFQLFLLIVFAWAVTGFLIIYCLVPIVNGPDFGIDCWELRIIASLAQGLIFSLTAGGLIALILFALTRLAKKSEKGKARLDQAAQSLSSSPTAPRLEQSEHIRKSSDETYRGENRD
jgi:hypothetical protein